MNNLTFGTFAIVFSNSECINVMICFPFFLFLDDYVCYDHTFLPHITFNINTSFVMEIYREKVGNWLLLWGTIFVTKKAVIERNNICRFFSFTIFLDMMWLKYIILQASFFSWLIEFEKELISMSLQKAGWARVFGVFE